MNTLNLQNLLMQQEDAKERILLLWGRICGGLTLDRLIIAEMESLVREYGLLSKIHLHAVANGTVPASLLAVLEEMEKAKAEQVAKTLPDLGEDDKTTSEN